jgi:hypothetical protein
MKKNIIVFSKIVIVQVMLFFPVLSPAHAGVGLYGKQKSDLSTQTDATRQSLLSSSGGSTGLFDNSSQSTLTAAPGGGGNGSHVPVADGIGWMMMMAGGYLLRRKL